MAGVVAAPFTAGASLAVTAAAVGKALLVGTATFVIGKAAGTYITSKAIPAKLELPMFQISPEEIFENKIGLLDVNFFNPNEYENIETVTGVSGEQTSTALTLRPTITKWYYAIRNFAIVALLLILVYTAIRIIISSSADDKAKYKQRLVDWIAAMCILFFMHYIMAFAITLTEEITKSVITLNKDYYILIGSEGAEGDGDDRKLEDYKYDNGENVFGGGELDQKLREAKVIVPMDLDGDGNEADTIQWPTNLMGKARIELQLEPHNITEGQQLMRKFGYTVIYLALIVYTMLFLFRYLRRLLMLTFLTIIAPLMAMTYPLDKMRDGSAQGFNMWLKEYMYNLLIQPVHLILYTVLIGAAMDLVVDNLLYGLVALGFILQAEKILRKFFGFDKASTVDGGSALGGAMAMAGLNQVTRALGRGRKNEKSSNGNKNVEGKQNLAGLRKADKDHDVEELMDDTFGKPRETLGSGETDSKDIPSGETTHTNLSESTGHNEFGLSKTLPPEPPEPPEPEEPEDTRGIGKYWLDETRPGRFVKDVRQGIGEGAKKVGGGIRSIPGRVSSGATRIANGAVDKLPMSDGVKRAIKNTGKGTVRGLKQAGKAAAYIGPKAAKFAAKTAVKGTLAGTGAMIGLTAGLVSDDFSNVTKWGTAGAAGGWIAGKGVTSVPGSIGSIGDGFENAAEGLYEATHTKVEIEERQNAMADRAWLQDKGIVEMYAEKLGVSKTEAKTIMKEKAQSFRRDGVTDYKIIIKAMKSKEFKGEYDSKQRRALAVMASQVSKKKDLESLEKSLSKRQSKEEVEKYITAIRKMNDWV